MDSKNRIKDTLMKLLEEHYADEITVKMLCLEGGFSKPTLYKHYYCLLDALDDAYQSEFNSAIENCDTYKDWAEGFRKFLEYLRTRKLVYLHLYKSTRRDDLMSMIRKHGEALVLKGINQCAEDCGFYVNDKDKEFMLSFYMGVFMTIIDNFFKNGMKDDPGYIMDMCNVMMHHHIRKTLRKLQDRYADELQEDIYKG